MSSRSKSFFRLVGSSARYALHASTFIALLAFGLRLYRLGDLNIWWDEGLAVWAVRKGFLGTTLWTASDVHPPLYFWGLWLWRHLTGETEFALRTLSLIYGVLTVPVTYRLGRSLGGRAVGWGSALLIAVGRFHVGWSQEMRMYILASLCATASLYFLLAWLRRERQDDGRTHWVLLLPYVLSTVGALYTVYLSVLVLLVENLFIVYWCIQRARDRRGNATIRGFGLIAPTLRRWVLAQVVILGLLAPWLVVALPRMRTWSVAEPFDFTLFLRLYATVLSTGISTNVQRYAPVVLPFVGLCAVGLSLAWRRRDAEAGASVPARDGSILLLLSLALPPLAVWLLSMPRGLFYSPSVEARYLLLFAPAFYVLLAWTISLLWRRHRAVGLLSAAFVLTVFAWTLVQHYGDRYLRDDRQTMVRVIASQAEEGDVVALVSGNRSVLFQYDYGRLPSDTWRPPVYALPPEPQLFTEHNVDQTLKPLTERRGRIWLASVEGRIQDPNDLATRWLDERYPVLLQHGFAHNRLTLYDLGGGAPFAHPDNLPPQYPLVTSWEDGTQMLGYDLTTDEFRPGDVIRLGTYWQPVADGRVRVRAVDAKGRLLEEVTQPLIASEGRSVRRQAEFAVFANTPPGRYYFEVEYESYAVEQVPAPVLCGSVSIRRSQDPFARGNIPAGPVYNVGEGIQFLGYRSWSKPGTALQQLAPGESFYLDLYWRAEGKLDQRFTIFTHLLGEAHNPATAGPVWAQHDSEPLDGGYPTYQWFVGEIILDRHLLLLDPHSPPGSYQPEIGMYDSRSQERLEVRDANGTSIGDRILLAPIVVVGNHE